MGADFRNQVILDITNLSMLALERGTTAARPSGHGDLAVKYGYSDSGEELSVADTKECWVFEIVGPGPLWRSATVSPTPTGWCASRWPHFRVDQLVCDRRVDFNDPENFMFALASASSPRKRAGGSASGKAPELALISATESALSRYRRIQRILTA